MRRPDEEDSLETTEANVEEERLGELPKMREMKARKARLHRKVQAHQMKELQEERLKMGQTMEGFLEQFQENQQQMLELERQVEQLKEREQQKALEIRRWQSSSDALQKDSLRLKRQLAVVTERLAKAEETAAEAHFQMQATAPASLEQDGACDLTSAGESALTDVDSNVVVEQLQMRLADYESLVVEFADQASKVVDDIDELEPTNLVPHFEDVGSVQKAGTSATVAALEDIGEQCSDNDPKLDGLEELKSQYTAAEVELKRLSSQCLEAENNVDIVTSQCAQLRVQVDDSMAQVAKSEQHAAESAERFNRAEAELQLAQERIRNLELETNAAVATHTATEAAMVDKLEKRTADTEAALANSNEERARLDDELNSSEAQLEQLRVELKKSAECLSTAEAEMDEMRVATETAVQRRTDSELSMQAFRDKHIASEKQYLRSLRRAQTVDQIVHDVHRKMLQVVSKAQQSKRESRRVQSEAVLAHALQQLRPHQGVGMVVDSHGSFDVHSSKRDEPIPEEGGTCSGAAEEHHPHRPEGHAASFHDLSPPSEYGSQLEELRAETCRAKAQICALQQSLAETKIAAREKASIVMHNVPDDAVQMQSVITETCWDSITEDRNALEARIRMLQEHLDEESEHFDLLAVTHENALDMFEKVKLHNSDLQKQLYASIESRKLVEDELREVVDIARREITGLLSKQQQESRRVSDAFQIQLQDHKIRQSRLAKALEEQSEAHLGLESEKRALAEQLDRERSDARRDVEFLRTQHDSLEEQHRSAKLQLAKTDQDIAESRREHGVLEQKLAEALVALEHGVAEQNSLRAKCRQLEEDASDRCVASEEQFEKCKAEIDASALQKVTLQQRLHDVELRLMNEEAARADAERQGRAAIEAEAAAQAKHESEVGRALELQATAFSSSEHRLAQATEEASLAIARRDAICAELLEVRSEFASASAAATDTQEQLARMAEDLAKCEQELADAAVVVKALKSNEQETLQEVSVCGRSIESLTSEQKETQRLLDLEREAADASRAKLFEIRTDYDQNLVVRQTLEKQLAELADVGGRSRVEHDDLVKRLHDAQGERDEAVRRAEHSALQAAHDKEEYETLQRAQTIVHAELAESVDLYKHAESARSTLQDQLGMARQSIQLFQDEVSDLQLQSHERRSEANAYMASEQKDASFVETLQTRVEELQRVEANAFAELHKQQEATNVALCEQNAQARQHEEELRRQAEHHSHDRENAIATNSEHLRRQMQDEAQKYMLAIQEQARTAVSSRDEQIVQLSQQVQAHQTHLTEKTVRLEVLEQELIALRKIDGDVLTERLGIASTELAEISIEREKLRQEVEVVNRELEATSTHRDQIQKHLSEVNLKLEEFQKQIVQKNDQVETLRKQTAEDLDRLSSELMQETSACNIAKQDCTQLCHEKEGLLDRLQILEAEAQTLAEERIVLKRELDITTQNMHAVSSQHESTREEINLQGPMLDELRMLLDQQTAEVGRLNQQLVGAVSERDTMACQLQGAQVAAANLAVERDNAAERELNAECSSLREQVVDVKRQLDAASAAGHVFQQQVEEGSQKLRSMSTQRDALQEQFDARGAELDTASRGQEARQIELDGVRQELVLASVGKANLETKLADIELKLGESTMEHQELLTRCREAEERLAQADVAPTSASDPAAVPLSVHAPAFEVQQAAAEREALEAAFRAQMEQVQRSLSARTIEAETLKHQLAVATAAAAPPSVTQQVVSGNAADEHLQVQVRQLQLRVSAVEEEKAVMLRDMREHILQLARENYDLKQRQLQGPTPQHVKSPRDNMADAQAPTQAQMAADVPEAPIAAHGVPETADEEIVKSGGGGWLSYVLSPFLTDSDMREIHAESYVGEALKGQPLATT